MNLTRKKVNTELERRILTGLIVSKNVCRSLLPILQPAFLKIEYGHLILKWVKSYYDEYEDAPGTNIETMFLSEKEELEAPIAALIQQFLNQLSENFENAKEFNEPYLVEQAQKLCTKETLLLHAATVQALTMAGDYEDAEQQIIKYNKPEIFTTVPFDPFDPANVKLALTTEQESLFTYPAHLGKLIGGLRRGWLMGVMAPEKRGKTWILIETAVQAIRQRLKVAFFTFEMPETEIATRYYKRITNTTQDEGTFRYPVLDCLLNQTGECNLPCRTNLYPLIGDTNRFPDFDSAMDYRVCTACQDIGPGDFFPSTWFEVRDRPALTENLVNKKLASIARFAGGRNLQIISHEQGSCNTTRMKHDLDMLEHTLGFVPDVVIADYADIMGKEDPRTTGREAINETWLNCKALAQQRKVLLVIATQSNRDSAEKKRVRMIHTGEDIRKIAHVNLMLVLNQTLIEKRQGRMRLALVAHRDVYFDDLKQVLITQHLLTGQSYLEGSVYRERATENDDGN